MTGARTIVCAAVLATMAGSAAFAQTAPAYPTKPIRWIVGYTPEAATAVMSRLIFSAAERSK